MTRKKKFFTDFRHLFTPVKGLFAPTSGSLMSNFILIFGILGEK
jgi:hypothetical protein